MFDAIVIGADRVLNEEGLRYNDEFVRHKALDLVGDLSLAGCDLIGHFVAHKSGHRLNADLVRSLLSDPAWADVRRSA